jgi:type IV pilus assembly protein PilV
MFNSRGFTLIEVLISMVILAIGLLGLAAMQGISLRDNQDAYYYQQATLLAYEMQDRIRGNSNVDWLSISPNYSTTNCVTAPGCPAADMAKNDLGYWEDSVKAILPPPQTVDIKLSSSVNKAGCKGTYTTSLCLITTWARTNSTSSNNSSKLSDTATYYLEVTP